MPNWKKVITSGSSAVLSDLTISGVTQPEIKFNGTSDAGVDFAIRATPEGLDFYEPEDGNKIHMQILDDGGVDAKYGLKINGTSVLSQARALSNVTGNISQWTNDSGYITSFTNTVDMGDGFKIANSDGTDQFTVTENEEIRFAGSGATSVSFDASTQKVTISSTNTQYSVGDGGLTSNNFTDADHTKLNGIATSANNYSLPLGSSSTRGGVKIGYTENGKNYPVELSSEKMYVNVPWSNTTYSVGDGGLTQNNFTDADHTKLNGIAASANNYSLPLGSSSTRGGVKIGYTENGKNYPVELSSEKMYVNVPWSNTTYSVGDGGLTQNNFTDADHTKLNGIAASANNYSLPLGTASTRGGFKIGYAESGKNYPVELSSEKMYVNVPWTDNNDNTTYSTNTAYGTTISGTQIRLNGGEIASGVDLDDMRTQGVFSQNSNSDAVAGDNYPEDKAGVLTVDDDMYGNGYHTHQMYAIYNSQNIYSRSYYNGSWTSWRNLAQDTTYSVGDGGLTQKNFTTTLKSKLDGIAASANNYSHPTFNGDDLSVDTGTLSGATVISDLDFNVTTDTNGHVTDATLTTLTTRELSKSDIGLANVANETRATILGGNLTGTINSVAVATVTAGAAAGATANQDSTSTIRSGTTAANVGLGNVTNESKATMFSSAALTGNPTAPTQAANNNSTRIATTAYVQTEITDLIGGAPGALNTLNELAAAINDDASFASSVTTSLGTKLPKSGGTMSGAINMNNSDITGVNNLAFADPGPNEGLSWSGGNMKLYESPNDLTTNTAGNLQIVYGTTRRLTIDNTGINVNGNATLSGFVLDGNTITGVDDSGEFTDNDAHIMTSAGVDDRISSRISGLTSNAGTMTGITINTATGLDGAGTLSGTGGTINLSLDLSELTDMTDAWVNSADEFVVLDSGVQKRKLGSEIFGSNAFNSTTIPSAANNATITITAGNALTTGGNFTTNQSSNETITIHHADTSTQASVDNSGNTVIQDVTLDGYGHVTGLTSTTLSIPTVNNATLTLSTSAGLDGSTTFTSNQSSATTFNVSLDLSELTDMTGAVDGAVDEIILLDNGAERRKRFAEIGLSAFSNDAGFTSHAAANNATLTVQGTGALGGSGTFTANQAIDATISISHDDTSTQASSNNSNGTVIQDVTLDGYGHVTGLGTYNLDGRYYTESESDSNFLGISAKAADSNLLDGLDLHTGRNNVANRVVRTDGSGYLNTGWINTTSGNTTSTITDIYVNTNDGYIRKATKAEFQSQMGIQNVVSNTDVDTGTETVASAPISSYSGYFFDYVVSNGGNFRAGTVTAVEYDGNVEFTETSTNDIGNTSDLTLFCDGSNGSDMKLRATATSDNWSVKVKMRLI